jgi:hypothetical protein
MDRVILVKTVFINDNLEIKIETEKGVKTDKRIFQARIIKKKKAEERNPFRGLE